ncbi:mucin-2-like [Penaeus japonicus]|uniref:mucin-2-like n=1 Tax=Penaeus japonicus TaxID=27405 RepID=UPI001C711AD5|nr:mucin-2-like [Penaeus japonicus]
MGIRAGGGGGKKHQVVIAPPPPPPPPQPAPIIVDAKLVPGPKPCVPITKQFTQYETVENHVPIYTTSVRPIYFPSTIYDTKYVTLTNYVTKLLQTTVYAVHTAYETSVSQGLFYESVTLPLTNPEYETRTNIQLAVVPSLVTEVVAVTRPSSQVIPVDKTRTRTLVLVPEFTTTEVVPYPIVTTNTIVETVNVPITRTVTVTAAPPPKKPPGPKVTKTLVQTNVHYTPTYVTNTEYVTKYTTVTERQRYPFTVTVPGKCGGGYQ